MPAGLERFLLAHRGQHPDYRSAPTFAEALEDITSNDRKDGHWIWYAFPQIRLGQTPVSVHFSLSSADEAKAFLAHPELSAHLFALTHAVREAAGRVGSVRGVVGADAAKLVSSLTLFEELAADEPDPRLDGFLEDAGALLERAEREGFPRCSRTLRFLAHGR
ncbi:MAG: hypothetical protein RL653_2121 [Pseudomonadota bacterium]|jgi:uncharacterized protein (DUF1810 family)